MTARPAEDWEALTADWQGVELPPPSALAMLRRRDRRHRQRLILIYAIEILISVAAVVASFELLRWRRDAPAILFAVMTTTFLGATWAFTVWNRRGTWRPIGESMADYLAISRERCRRRLRTVRFVIALVTVQLAVMATWTALRSLTATETPADPWLPWRSLVAIVVMGGYLGWAAWFRRRALHELAWLDKIQRAEHEA